MARTVLYLAWAPFFSGAERALMLTLRSLDPSRYTPRVLAGTGGEFVEQVRALGVPCDVCTLKPLDRHHPIESVMSAAAVLRAAHRHRVSLIHANEMASFQPGGYAARALRLPAVTHVRFPDRAAGYRWFFRSRFSRAMFVSRYLLDDACREAPDLFEGRSEVLYDGVEPQRAWTDDEAATARRELGLPPRAVVVALTGQIAEVKGIWDFVEAARILASEGEEPFFAVLGDDLRSGGELRRAMEARVGALGLSNRFAFLGFRNDAPRMVQAFDIVAVPSHVEPLGNATLEAMAAGRPVVGSRVGGIPEMVVDGQTGFLTPSANPGELAGALRRLAADPALRARMSAAARARAAEVFSIEAHGVRLQRSYDELCTPNLALQAERELA